MSCKDCIEVPAGSPYEQDVVVPFGEDWPIELRLKNKGEYYNADNATFSMYIKESEYDSNAEAKMSFDDDDFSRDTSDEGTAASIAFNDQVLNIVDWATATAIIDLDSPYWFFIMVYDPTYGIDKQIRRGRVTFTSK